MGRKAYDFVYLTNTPSFYKLNLCNEIAKTNTLLLVLYGYGAEAVNKELESSSHYRFDFVFINKGDSNKRNKFVTLCRLFTLMGKVKAKKILYAGWLAPEYNLYSFFSPKRKNCMVCESSVFDVSFHGVSGMVKKAIIGRMSVALPSGKPHDELFMSIGFMGRRNCTGSVGIFYKPRRLPKPIHTPFRYLYVGRLVEVKNLKLLIEAFNENGKPLTIVGQGRQEHELKAMAHGNIVFCGFVDNERLGEVYQNHDVFVLPSKYEPWGLVVEEALYWGLPVIASDKVGSSVDMVKDLNTGLVFESKNIASLQDAIAQMEQNYSIFADNIKSIDWEQRERTQVNAYTSLLEI